MEKCGHLELKIYILIRTIARMGKGVIAVTFLLDVAVHNPWLTGER